MITIRSIDEMLTMYSSFGGIRKDVENGFQYMFPHKKSKMRFWGNLHGFCAADADFTYPQDTVIRNQFKQRYIGIGLGESGETEIYTRKRQTLRIGKGMTCFVYDSPVPFFMKISGGQRLKFQGLYFQEAFFKEHQIPLYDNFWWDAKHTIHGKTLHSPEFISIYRRIRQCRLNGLAFDVWMKGIGIETVGYLIDTVQKLSLQPPMYLDAADSQAVERAKRIITDRLNNLPTVIDLCKEVGVNKNKLQKIFRLTEGKSVAEYVRTVRMEKALDLLEENTLSICEIAREVGYHGISNFYSAFHHTFGDTPATIQQMIKKR